MAIQWPLVLFTVFAGCGAGALVFTGLGEFFGLPRKARFTAVAVALVLLIIGGLASVLHLQQPANVMAAVANLGSLSGISLELIFLVICGVVAIIYLIALNREASGALTKVIAVIGIVGGAALCFVVGNGYVMPSYDNWNTPLLPLGYFFGNVLMGAFVVAALGLGASAGKSAASAHGSSEASEAKSENVAAPSKGLREAFPPSVALAILGAAAAVVYCLYMFVLSGVDAAAVTLGVLAVVVGGVAPAVCAAVAMKTKSQARGGIIIGLACAVLGAVAFRCLMWMAGTAFLDALGNVSSVLLL